MFIYCKYFLLFFYVVGIEPETSRWFHSDVIFKQKLIVMRQDISAERSEYIKKDVVNSPNIQKDKKISNEMVREKTRWEPFKNIA